MTDILTPNEVYRTFARNLRLLRKALDMRYVRHFSERVGIPKPTLDKYEQGKRLPDLWSKELQLIAAATGATSDWLCYDRIDTLPSDLRMKIAEYQRRQL